MLPSLVQFLCPLQEEDSVSWSTNSSLAVDAQVAKSSLWPCLHLCGAGAISGRTQDTCSLHFHTSYSCLFLFQLMRKLSYCPSALIHFWAVFAAGNHTHLQICPAVCPCFSKRAQLPWKLIQICIPWSHSHSFWFIGICRTRNLCFIKPFTTPDLKLKNYSVVQNVRVKHSKNTLSLMIAPWLLLWDSHLSLPQFQGSLHYWRLPAIPWLDHGYILLYARAAILLTYFYSNHWSAANN